MLGGKLRAAWCELSDSSLYLGQANLNRALLLPVSWGALDRTGNPNELVESACIWVWQECPGLEDSCLNPRTPSRVRVSKCSRLSQPRAGKGRVLLSTGKKDRLEKAALGLPWWLSGKVFTWQCRRQGFNP